MHPKAIALEHTVISVSKCVVFIEKHVSIALTLELLDTNQHDYWIHPSKHNRAEQRSPD